MDPEVSATPDTPEGQPPVDAGQPVDTSAEGQEGQVDEGQAPELNDEDYRLNFLGTDKFEIPRDAPEEVRTALKNLEKSLNKGWTEKNMKFSDTQKSFVAAQQQAVEEIEAQRAEIKELAKITALQERLEAYDKLTFAEWQSWAQSDPQGAQSGQIEYQTLQRQVTQKQAELDTKKQERLTKNQQQEAAWLQFANEQLGKNLKDWGPEKGHTIAKFVAQTYLNNNTPFDAKALDAVSKHHGLIQMAEEARLYRESLKRAVTKEQPPPAAPVAKVRGAAPATGKDPSKMSDEEWLAWRNQDLANKRKAAPMNMMRKR
jgi:DNA-binding phage protein